MMMMMMMLLRFVLFLQPIDLLCMRPHTVSAHAGVVLVCMSLAFAFTSLPSHHFDRTMTWRHPCAFSHVNQSTFCRPSFLIIGAAKSGTSSLYYYLVCAHVIGLSGADPILLRSRDHLVSLLMIEPLVGRAPANRAGY
jgi:hypothetical protein